MTITSQHNAKLKEIRKLSQRRRSRDRAARFVAEGEDLLAAADAAGWEPVERYCAAGSGLPGVEGGAGGRAGAWGVGRGAGARAVEGGGGRGARAGPGGVSRPGSHDPGNVGAVMRSA